MAAARKTGASSPASRTVVVRGLEINVDESFISSWEAFEMIRAFNSDDLDTFQKFDLSIQLIEAATGITKDEIVDAAGGKKAPAVDVVNTAAEIVQAINPKN